MIVNAPPAAGGACRHTDKRRSARKGAIAYRTVLRLDDIPCLGAEHLAARILVLDPAQEPVGDLNAIRMFPGWFRRINMLR